MCNSQDLNTLIEQSPQGIKNAWKSQEILSQGSNYGLPTSLTTNMLLLLSSLLGWMLNL